MKLYQRKLEYLAANIMGKASMVHIYFRDLGVEKYSTDELYNIVDLIGTISISWSILQNFRSPEKCQFWSPEMGPLDHSPILTETASNPIKNKKKKSIHVTGEQVKPLA